MPFVWVILVILLDVHLFYRQHKLLHGSTTALANFSALLGETPFIFSVWHTSKYVLLVVHTRFYPLFSSLAHHQDVTQCATRRLKPKIRTMVRWWFRCF